MSNQEIIDRLHQDHNQRIAWIPPHLIKCTYPKLKRVENSSKVMVELWTEYWTDEQHNSRPRNSRE